MARPVGQACPADRPSGRVIAVDQRATTVVWTRTAKPDGGLQAPVQVWESGTGGWDAARTKPL